MAVLLHRLGRFAAVHRRRVLGAWAVLLVAIGVGAATLSGPTSDTFTLPGTEAQDARDQLAERFPAAQGSSARVVFSTAEGAPPVTSRSAQRVIASTLARAGDIDGVVQVTDPSATRTISPDRRAAFADVRFPREASELSTAQRDALLGLAAERDGVSVDVGGEAAEQPETGVSPAEIVGVAIAFLVLCVASWSLVGAVLPIATAFASVGVGLAAVAIATGFLDLASVTPILALMLGLAVGIDYSLFLLVRYRALLSDGVERTAAIARATATAGGAVTFAGGTVVIALAGLSLLGMPFLTAMGLASAFTVAVAVLAALTLLPALLAVAGPRLDPGGRGVLGRIGRRRARGVPAGRRWAAFVTRRPWPVALVTTILLLVVAFPATNLTLGLPDAGTRAPDDTSRQAYDVLAAGFGPGANSTLLATVDLRGQDDPRAALQATRGALQGTPGVVQASPPVPNASGDLAVLQLVPAGGPNDEVTKDAVRATRDRAAGLERDGGPAVLVGGITASNIDVSQRLADALPVYLLVVVGLTLVLLTMLFRSLLVPLKAALGFLLSIAATLGATTFVFQDGHLGSLVGLASSGPILSFLPVLIVGILFGLAMDYEVFLVSSMHERVGAGEEAVPAVVDGFALAARVVAAAAAIMTSVFAGFVFTDDPIIKSVGFALAFGILVDAFVVRMTLVPAVMTLLGRRAWSLPRPLARVLPRIDVEGRDLEPPPSATEERRVPASAG